jgi:hypothetical protein
MVEYTGNENIDHGPVRKGDWHRKKRLKTNAIESLLESGKKTKNINTFIGKVRDAHIPQELLNSKHKPYNQPPNPEKELPDPYKRNGPRCTAKVRETFKPGPYELYYCRFGGKIQKRKWKSTREDYTFYDARNCYRTAAEANGFIEPEKVEEVLSIEETIKRLKKEEK